MFGSVASLHTQLLQPFPVAASGGDACLSRHGEDQAETDSNNIVLRFTLRSVVESRQDNMRKAPWFNLLFSTYHQKIQEHTRIVQPNTQSHQHTLFILSHIMYQVS